jgi:deazaflavin-dependent oxidoreductase (nitroreductase family)
MANAKDVLFRNVTNLHKAIFKASKGRLLGRGAGMPVLILTTTGAKSGKKRESMLTSPLVDGDRVMLVASYGGDDRNPAWFHNLKADPDVEVTMGGRTRAMRAKVADAGERAELWPRITGAHKNYAGYQRRTDREIPVVILEPKE